MMTEIFNVIHAPYHLELNYLLIFVLLKGKGVGLESGISSTLFSRLHNYPADHWKWPHSYILSFLDYGSHMDARFRKVTISSQLPIDAG